NGSGTIALTADNGGALVVRYSRLSADPTTNGIVTDTTTAAQVFGGGIGSLANAPVTAQTDRGPSLPVTGKVKSFLKGLPVLGSRISDASGESGGEEEGPPPGAGTELLRRILEEGQGAFRLADLGTSITDPEAIRVLFDGLDDRAGNVTLTQSASETRYD